MSENTITSVIVDALGGATQFSRCDGRVWLARLCGMLAGRQGEGTGPTRVQGMAVLQVDGRRYEGNELALDAFEEQAHAVLCRWRVGSTALCLSTTWKGSPNTGIVSRRDSLSNTGNVPVVVSRCLARMAFPAGHYECYTQASRWCRENQGAWQPLHTGIALRHASGRTTEESTPYLALRPIGAQTGVAFHILPCGNWTIRVSPVNEGGELPYAVVELGLADENLQRVLRPGDTFDLPEILVQPLPQGEPRLGAPVLHRYLLAHHFVAAKPAAPVVYNTWFDQFEILNVPRLREQLAAARAVGCEVFTIDAGWYGAGGSNWWAQAGDWREKNEAAFFGKMRAFADEVRSAGLGFGLWMEPERFGPEAPIRAEHPEWFVLVGGAARMDLTQPAAYAYLRGEIGRLVETYTLAWMKIDFNFIMDADASGAELADYSAAWYRLLDEIRVAYPGTFFEGCSSGAMRGDLEALTHVDGHFLSDSVNPVDMLRISQGAWLRLPPGRLGRWTVVRSAGQVLPRYGKSVADSSAAVLTPCGALWEPAETVDLSFALLAAMPGMFGVSGDLASLSADARVMMGAGIAFYKSWRSFITASVAHLLTPPETLDRREGWVGVQLQAVDDDTSLVFVYRLGFCGAPPLLRLQGLLPEMRYTVKRGFGKADTLTEYTGAALMCDGLKLDGAGSLTGSANGAEVFVMTRNVARRITIKEEIFNTVLIDIDGTLTGPRSGPATILANLPHDPLARILMKRDGLSESEALRRSRGAVALAEGSMVGGVWPFGAHTQLGVSDGELWNEMAWEAQQGVQVHDDARCFLQGLRSRPGLRVFTATTNPRLTILSKLSVGGLADGQSSPWLTDAFGGEEVSPGGKCGPGFYCAILNRVHAVPEQTLMIGDDDTADRQWAAAAGIRHVAIVNRNQTEALVTDPDGTLRINRLDVLLPWIDRLSAEH